MVIKKAEVIVRYILITIFICIMTSNLTAYAEEITEVIAEEEVVGARTVPYYNININGGSWDGTYYKVNGKTITDAFFCDGTYTYYLQTDGTPMKNRLTYHPDGVHLIYFDNLGHELFDTFNYCQDVGYTCYFDTYGYAYFDQITFIGRKAYYLDSTGRLKKNEYFMFENGVDLGYAQADGSLMNNGFGYDPFGRVVFYHWNGMIARGLITDGAWYYNMDLIDGHYVGQFAVSESSTQQTENTPPSQQAMINEVYRLCLEANPNCVIGSDWLDGGCQWVETEWCGTGRWANINDEAANIYEVLREYGTVKYVYVECGEWQWDELSQKWKCSLKYYWA